MARTIKKGLDYFPVDTNILSDLKVRRIKREYGAESFLLYMTLLCDIYANGYWLEANDDYLFDLSEQMQISESRILEMLQAMAKVGMFDADLFTEQQILTSEPIPDKGSDSTFYCRPNWMNFVTSSFPAEKKKVSRRKKTLSAVSTTGCPITERRKKPGRRKNGNHGCRKSWRWTGSAMFLLKLRNKYLPGNALRTCQPGI